MDNIPFVITPETGKKILDWCMMGNTLENAKLELSKAQDIPALRDILKKYPEFRKELEPIAIQYKDAIQMNEAMNAASTLGIK
jgi:hypothetical protein